MEDNVDPEEPIRIPVEDTIDLHTFLPQEVSSLLEDYLSECVAAGIFEVRIVHGKGKGMLREKVHSFLRHSPLVAAFVLADERAGSWGATLVSLKRP